MTIFYGELARWWPLVSPVEEYEGEAREFLRVIVEQRPHARTALELGSGGGHNAYYFKRHFAMTLSDLSSDMLAVSRQLNPDCEHVLGDMRTLELGRTFDVVFVHDAIDYMTSETDLAASLETVYRHLAPDGLALVVPDHVKERYASATECGGSDGADGSALRFLEWSLDVAPSDTTGTVHYSFVLREADGSLRCLHEAHPFGLFSQATWLQLFERSGFNVELVEERTDEERVPRLMFLARRNAQR